MGSLQGTDNIYFLLCICDMKFLLDITPSTPQQTHITIFLPLKLMIISNPPTMLVSASLTRKNMLRVIIFDNGAMGTSDHFQWKPLGDMGWHYNARVPPEPPTGIFLCPYRFATNPEHRQNHIGATWCDIIGYQLKFPFVKYQCNFNMVGEFYGTPNQ